MAKLTDGSLQRALADIRNHHRCPIIFIYLHEAHARDLWPLSPLAPLVHTDLPARLLAASAFLERWPSLAAELECSFVDSMSNELALKYGLWPERVVLLKQGCAKWISDHELYGAEELLEAVGRVFAEPAN